MKYTNKQLLQVLDEDDLETYLSLWYAKTARPTLRIVCSQLARKMGQRLNLPTATSSLGVALSMLVETREPFMEDGTFLVDTLLCVTPIHVYQQLIGAIPTVATLTPAARDPRKEKFSAITKAIRRFCSLYEKCMAVLQIHEERLWDTTYGSWHAYVAARQLRNNRMNIEWCLEAGKILRQLERAGLVLPCTYHQIDQLAPVYIKYNSMLVAVWKQALENRQAGKIVTGVDIHRAIVAVCSEQVQPQEDKEFSKTFEDFNEHHAYTMKASMLNACMGYHEIHSKELWRAGGFSSWEEYKETTRHAADADVMVAGEAWMYGISHLRQFQPPKTIEQLNALMNIPDHIDRTNTWFRVLRLGTPSKISLDTIQSAYREVHASRKNASKITKTEAEAFTASVSPVLHTKPAPAEVVKPSIAEADDLWAGIRMALVDAAYEDVSVATVKLSEVLDLLSVNQQVRADLEEAEARVQELRSRLQRVQMTA